MANETKTQLFGATRIVTANKSDQHQEIWSRQCKEFHEKERD
jgi:hypothetical protein